MPQPGKTFGYFYIHMKVTYGTIFGILKIFEKVGHSAQCGEPLPGAEKKEATTRQRPAGATSTGDGEPLPGAEIN